MDVDAFKAVDDPIPISALNHYAYCPRRCALIHMEQVWDENLYTLRGREVHERVDEPGSLHEEGIVVERGLPLWSVNLGLIGKADVVEFHGATPYPVEYKSGARRRYKNDDVQVCAQAICLEEMTGLKVPRGAVYHFSSRRRREVVFTPELRAEVVRIVGEIRTMLTSERLPPVLADARCPPCSLIDSCLPFVLAKPERLRNLDHRLFVPAKDEEG